MAIRSSWSTKTELSFTLKKTDFDRAFGCIVSATKDEIVRDFAIDTVPA